MLSWDIKHVIQHKKIIFLYIMLGGTAYAAYICKQKQK